MRPDVSASAFAMLATLGTTAAALTIDLRRNPAAERGSAVSFSATASGEGDVQYTWDFGDGTRIGPVDSATIEHTYDAVGHYPVIAIASDASGLRSASFVQTIHHPLTASKPTSSSTIVVDDREDRVCVVNADHDSITCLDQTTLEPVFVAPVGRHPRTLTIAGDGTIWVANQASGSISVLRSDGDPLAVVGPNRVLPRRL
jgi:DNA-binding beta-propeller fold protein YncE